MNPPECVCNCGGEATWIAIITMVAVVISAVYEFVDHKRRVYIWFRVAYQSETDQPYVVHVVVTNASQHPIYPVALRVSRRGERYRGDTMFYFDINEKNATVEPFKSMVIFQPAPEFRALFVKNKTASLRARVDLADGTILRSKYLKVESIEHQAASIEALHNHRSK